MAFPHGPWKKLLTAQWGNYPLTVYQNPAREMLFTLVDQTATEPGVLVLIRKALIIQGEVSKIAAQKKEYTLIEKGAREGRTRFLILDSTPKFISYSEEALAEEINKQHDELEAFGKIMQRSIEAIGGSAVELKDATEQQAQALLGDPLAFLNLARKGIEFVTFAGKSRTLFGVDREGKKIEGFLENLKTVQVVGETRERRLHAMHVVMENALMSNIPCIVFDSSGAFSGFSLPSKDKEHFEEFKMDKMPLAFPVKSYKLGEGLFVDLTFISPEVLLQAFGLEKSDVAPLISKIYEEKRKSISLLGDLLVELGNAKETKEFTRYLILKAIRVLEVIQKAYPALFGKNISEELSMPWKDGIGRVVYVNLSNQRREVKELVVESLLQAISGTPLASLGLIVAFDSDAEELTQKVSEQLSALEKEGKGFVAQAEHENSLKKLPNPSVLIELVGNESIITEKGEEAKKRFIIRPAYSLCSELMASG